MAFKLGNADVDALRLGSAALDRLMLGTVEIWSSQSAVVVGDTVWDAGLSAAGLGLSGKTATDVGGSNYENAIANTSKTSGKWYLEFRLDRAPDNGNAWFGIADSTVSDGANYERADRAPIALAVNQNRAVHASTVLVEDFGAGGLGTGDVIGLAIDLTAGTGSIRVNGGRWAGGSETAGIITGQTGPYRPACMLRQLGVCTLRTTAAEFTHTPPSGYLGWDDA